MFLPVDPSSGLPIYRQIMDQVRRMVASGALCAGERLPSVRSLSASLGVNPLTAGKAYRELEREGLLRMRRGRGMFVAADLDASEAARQALLETAQRMVLEAGQAGLGRQELLRLLDETWQRLLGTRAAGGDP